MRGLALGDAFGQTWFFCPAEVLETAFARRRVNAGPWLWTDDTAMALSLLRILDRHGRVEQDALAREFAVAYKADPRRGYGPSMHQVLPAIGAGEDWASVAARQFAGQGSWGNGAAMRVAPLGAWFAHDLDAVAEEAARSAVVTHAHPEATAGAVAVAVAAAVSARDGAGEEMIDTVTSRVPDGEVAVGMRRAAGLSRSANPRDAATVLGCGARISAMDTVPYAIWCAARHPHDLVEALWVTASAGGDVDTTCAIVGGIVGASAGLGQVPTDWLAACQPLPPWVEQIDATT